MSRKRPQSTSRAPDYASDSFLGPSVVLLQNNLENFKEDFETISQSLDFVSILHFCTITVRRFCKEPEQAIQEINALLSSATRRREQKLAEEFFIIVIFLLFNFGYNDEIGERVTSVFTSFPQDLGVAGAKAKSANLLEAPKPKPKGSRQVDDSLPDKQLLAIYMQKELDFWTLVLEFQRFSAIRYLINELRDNNKIQFPSEMLQDLFRGSEGAMRIFKETIANFFDSFFSDQRWIDFVSETPELILYMITDVFKNLKPESYNKCAKLYVPFLLEFFENIFTRKVTLESFIDFITLTSDETFVNVLDSNPSVSTAFQQFMISNFDELFGNEKWRAFIRNSPLLIQFICSNIYNSIPPEKHDFIYDFDEQLLDNIIYNENVAQIVEFMLKLPVGFLLYQFKHKDHITNQFRNLFTINFDSYIVSRELRELIVSSDELLDIIIREVIPLSESKEVEYCRELYEFYLDKKLSVSQRNVQPLAEFVKDISSTVPSQHLKFNKLSFATQISLFNYVSHNISPNELANHKNLYAEFYIPFLQSSSLMHLLPTNMRQPFYISIMISYLTTQTLGLGAVPLYNLSIFMADDPFAEQEHAEFFNFLVKNSQELLPIIVQDEKIMRYCWNFILRSEKDLNSPINRDFISLFSLILLQRELPSDTKLFQIASSCFNLENYQKNVNEDERNHIIFNLSQCFLRSMESKIPDRLALRNYQEEAQALIEKLSRDSFFAQAASFSFNKENKAFIKILLSIFTTDYGWTQLISKPELFVKFTEISLELFPQATKSSFFTLSRYEDLFSLFNKASYQISQIDIIREAFLTYFLGSEAKLNIFFSCVTQPLHRPVFFTEFSNVAKNSILASIFSTYFEHQSEGIPIHTVWLVYVNTMNLPFIHIKNHQALLDRIRDAFVTPNQDEFDAMFPRTRILELESVIYKLSKNIGLGPLFEFRKVFSTLKPGPNNCFNEIFEDTVLRYIPETKGETPEEIRLYEEEHPRYRQFQADPPKYVDLFLGIFAFALIMYISTISFSDVKAITVVSSLIASLGASVIALLPLYFSKLSEKGFNAWFFTQLVLIMLVTAFSFVSYAHSGKMAQHSPFIFVVVGFCSISIYRMMSLIDGIPIEFAKSSEEELEDQDEKDNKTKDGDASNDGKKNEAQAQEESSSIE